MRYFDEMNDKYGFGDGTTIPQEAQAARHVYIQVLNPLLQKYGSQYRILPFDRGGSHNSLMWLRVPKAYYEQLPQEDTQYGDHDPNLETNESDDAWDQAIEEAHTLYLDDLYETTITINTPHLQTLLNQINQEI